MKGTDKPKVLFFDLDGTLLDNSSHADVVAQVCEIAASRGRFSAQAIQSANAKAWAEFWPNGESGWASGAITDVPREIWRRALSLCGCEDAGVLNLVLAEHRRLGEAAAHLFPDVRPVIESLRESGYRMALVTNGGSGTQRGRLASLGIERWFEAVAISAEVGALKPESTIFKVVLRDLAVRPDEVWHTGDSLQTDVQGAANAGLSSVWLNRDGNARSESEPAPDIEISSLAELLVLLKD